MLKKISTLIGSAGISQVISFIALPVISRLVQPEEFGYFYYYSSIAGIIGGISTFKMEQLFFSTNKNEAFYLRKKIIHVVLCVFLLSLLVVLGLRYFSIVNEPVWLIIPFGILSTSLIIPNYFYLLRIGDIQWLGYSRVLLAISQSGLQILACIINPSFYSLLFSFFLSQFINAFFLSIKCHPIKTNVITGREKESTKFGVLIYASISSIFQALNTSFLPSFFIYFNYIHIGGIVAVIHRMCMIPVNFLASNISHIVLAEFKSKQETIVNILLASLFILIFTDVILFLCFDEIGKLIIWFLGPEWTEVNDILKYFIFIYSFIFLNVIVSQACAAAQMQKVHMICEFIKLFTMVSVFVYCQSHIDKDLIFIFFMANSLIMFLCILYLILKLKFKHLEN